MCSFYKDCQCQTSSVCVYALGTTSNLGPDVGLACVESLPIQPPCVGAPWQEHRQAAVCEPGSVACIT